MEDHKKQARPQKKITAHEIMKILSDCQVGLVDLSQNLKIDIAGFKAKIPQQHIKSSLPFMMQNMLAIRMNKKKSASAKEKK